MANPAKRKGTAYESLIRDYLNEQGIPAYRPAQAGRFDTGDLHGVDPFIVQAKAYANLADALRNGVDGATEQAKNAGRDYGVAFIKRPRRNVRDSYVAMRAEDFVRLLHEVRAARGIG